MKNKYRGKDIKTKEWVYGYYIGITAENTHDNHGIISINNGLEYEVDPETVGQYIGLDDKNKKEAFFQDLVRLKIREDNLYEIVQDNFGIPCFRGIETTECIEFIDYFGQMKGNDFEIIRSTHDNKLK